jgi:hypothetical protein
MKLDLPKVAIVGVGLFMAFLSHYQILAPWGMAGWLLGGAIAGGGALAMYGRPAVGAVMGFVIQLISLAWMIFHAQHFIG